MLFKVEQQLCVHNSVLSDCHYHQVLHTEMGLSIFNLASEATQVLEKETAWCSKSVYMIGSYTFFMFMNSTFPHHDEGINSMCFLPLYGITSFFNFTVFVHHKWQKKICQVAGMLGNVSSYVSLNTVSGLLVK